MRTTTLCYIERDGAYLMLLRNKKEKDLNKGKWIGVGGKAEKGETPRACVIRETEEETGLVLSDPVLRGVIEFVSDRWEDEHMYLYTADSFTGTVRECDEGELAWIPKEDVPALPTWEGDRIFLKYLLEDRPFFHLELRYGLEDELKGSRLLPNLILASQSPRRYDLLTQIGWMPAVLPSAVEEVMAGETPEEIVKHLSMQKAEDVAADFSHGEIVIGADTIVVADGKILGKPKSEEEAAQMLRLLSGRTHQVITGVTVIRCADAAEREEKINFASVTDVHVYPLLPEEIRAYVESGEPMDKAGAYAVQGGFAPYVRGIDGEYANVVGLPVSKLYHELRGVAPELFEEGAWKR